MKYSFDFELISYYSQVVRFRVDLDNDKKYGYYYEKEFLEVKLLQKYALVSASNAQEIVAFEPYKKRVDVNDKVSSDHIDSVRLVGFILKVLLIPSALIYIYIITNTRNSGIYFFLIYIYHLQNTYMMTLTQVTLTEATWEFIDQYKFIFLRFFDADTDAELCYFKSNFRYSVFTTCDLFTNLFLIYCFGLLILVVFIVSTFVVKQYQFRDYVMELCGVFFTLSFQPILMNSAVTMKLNIDKNDWTRNSLSFSYIYVVSLLDLAAFLLLLHTLLLSYCAQGVQ